jgi:hypothetical protein
LELHDEDELKYESPSYVAPDGHAHAPSNEPGQVSAVSVEKPALQPAAAELTCT